MRHAQDPTKTSYRRKPVESMSMYNEWGYVNRFGGFHYTTDTYAYVGLFRLLIKELLRGQRKSARWIWRRMIWYRWHHRMCDTTDFHHEIYCLRDSWVRKRDAQDRWKEVWKDKHLEYTKAAVDRVIRNFDIYSISIVDHHFHGPWSYDDGICRGCGVGFVTVKPSVDSMAATVMAYEEYESRQKHGL